MKILQITAIALTVSVGISSCKSAAQNTNNKDNTIRATLSPNRRELGPNYVCFNVNTVQVDSWRSPKLIAAIDLLKPKLLRLPGGDGSNFWDWERGGLIQDTDDLPDELPSFLRANRARRYTKGKLEDFQAGLEASNTKPIFVLNMLTSDLKSQMKMLKTAREMGIKVEHIELGNEFYFGLPNYRKIFPNPQAYADISSRWITAIKQEFPDAKISTIGVIPKQNQNYRPRYKNWNRALLKEALPKADAIVLHIYENHGLNNNDRDFDEEDRQFPFFTPEETEIILGEPFRNWQNIRNHSNFQLIPDDKKIWITEYNLMEKIIYRNKEKTPRVIGSWAHGMYVMAMSLSFLEDPRVEIACNHSLITRNSMFAAVFGNRKSFINPSNPDLEVTPYSLSATGSALQFLGKATEQVNSAQKISFVNSPILKGKNNYQYPALYGWIFTDTSSNQQALIMNLGDRKIEVNLENIFPDTTNYQQIYGNPRTLVTAPEILDRNQGQINRKITLPPHSITRLH